MSADPGVSPFDRNGGLWSFPRGRGKATVRPSRRWRCPDQGLLRAVKPISSSQWSDGFGADTGPSQGDPCRPTFRPKQAFRKSLSKSGGAADASLANSKSLLVEKRSNQPPGGVGPNAEQLLGKSRQPW
jgi:hypothetical protein